MLISRRFGTLFANTLIPGQSSSLRVAARLEHGARPMADEQPNVDAAAEYLTRAEAPHLPWWASQFMQELHVKYWPRRAVTL